MAGYVVEHELARAGRGERRYAVRGPAGDRATLIAARRPFAGRASRSRFHLLATRRAELDHPGAIRVRAVADHHGAGALITDEYPECTFADLLDGAPLSPERVVEMFAPVAAALDVAHAHGLVHRDLDAESLLLFGWERLRIDTFGILLSDDDADAEWTSANVGDVRYVPPDPLRGEPLGAGGNVYSLGALMVDALTGAPPYGGDRVAMMYGHMSGSPPRPSERVPELGRDADDVVARALAKRPYDRPESATALLRELADALRVPFSAPDVETEQPTGDLEPHLRLVPERAHAAPTAPAAPARVRLGRRRVVRLGRRRVVRLGRRRVVAVAVVVLAIAAGAVAGMVAQPFGGDEPAPAIRPPAGAATWAQLGERHAALRAELAAARVPAAQAEAASGLAGLFARSASAGGPGALTAAAREAASAYSQLAAAARANDRAAYADAAGAVTRAEQRLALARLRALRPGSPTTRQLGC